MDARNQIQCQVDTRHGEPEILVEVTDPVGKDRRVAFVSTLDGTTIIPDEDATEWGITADSADERTAHFKGVRYAYREARTSLVLRDGTNRIATPLIQVRISRPADPSRNGLGSTGIVLGLNVFFPEGQIIFATLPAEGANQRKHAWLLVCGDDEVMQYGA